MVFVSIVRRALYIQARSKFVTLNNLVPVDDVQLRKLLPECVIRSGAHDELLTGYTLELSSGSVVVIDYMYTVGEGKHSTNYVYGVAAMEFNKQYPHIFLDSRSNGKIDKYQSSQRVNLEGNFNKYFDLYMPDGSGAGSLTVLSPDVMQVLIDQVQAFDVEIYGQNVCLITTGESFIQEKITAIINASNAIIREFSELNTSWQPVYNLQGKPFELRRSNGWKRIIIGVVVFLGYFIITTFYGH